MYQLVHIFVIVLGSVLCDVLWKQQIVLILNLRLPLNFDIMNVAVIYKGEMK